MRTLLLRVHADMYHNRAQLAGFRNLVRATAPTSTLRGNIGLGFLWKVTAPGRHEMRIWLELYQLLVARGTLPVDPEEMPYLLESQVVLVPKEQVGLTITLRQS